MRHTSSPRELPDVATVNPDNVNSERQLDEKGRRDATAIGEALRRLQVPVGEVLSSPAYRALETARLAGFDEVTVQQELGNDGMAESSAQYAEWLVTQAANAPRQGNRLLITHGPNISAAFAQAAEGLDEGDMLVIDPQSGDGPQIVAKIKSSQWPAL
jgi:phosphohistidine phosphatase SixA